MLPFPPLPLFDWYGLVIGTIRKYGIDFMAEAIEMSEDDPWKTRAHFVPLHYHCVVLGRRTREGGEGLEVFFEILKGPDVAVAIIHTIEDGARTWKYTGFVPTFINLVGETRTTDLSVSLEWVDAIMGTVKPDMITEPPP